MRLWEAKKLAEEIKTWSVTGEGTGKPDYTREITRGNIRQGMNLLDNEKAKFFFITLSNRASIYPWVQPPLAVGASARFIDMETGLPMPYTVAQGYNFTDLAHFFSFEQPVRGELFISMPPIPVGQCLMLTLSSDSFAEVYEQEIIGCELSRFDPTLATAHQYDIMGTNVGVAPCFGSGYLLFIESAEGTPAWPKTKTVKCPFCDVTRKVLQSSTVIKCANPKCKKTFVVWYIPPGGKVKIGPKGKIQLS